jgi:hypothetical protein
VAAEYSHLSREELRKMLELDMVDIRQRVEMLLLTMQHCGAGSEQGELVRIGIAAMELLAYVPAESHVLVAAVTMEMLLAERSSR